MSLQSFQTPSILTIRKNDRALRTLAIARPYVQYPGPPYRGWQTSLHVRCAVGRTQIQVWSFGRDCFGDTDREEVATPSLSCQSFSDPPRIRDSWAICDDSLSLCDKFVGPSNEDPSIFALTRSPDDEAGRRSGRAQCSRALLARRALPLLLARLENGG
eukprot:COSAG06_NODE_2287_length_7155_cov_20.776927_2_plen_159_part_00